MASALSMPVISTRPRSLITPFTLSTGMGLAEIVERLKLYVEETLVPELEAELTTAKDDFLVSIGNANTTITAALAGWQAIHNAYMEDVDASLQALNDSAMGELIENPASIVGTAVRSLFALKSDLDSLATKSSVTTLGEGLTAVSGDLSTLSTLVGTHKTAGDAAVAALNTALGDKAHIQAPNRGYSVEYVKTPKEHYILRLNRGATSGPVVQHRTAADSLSPTPAREPMSTFYSKTRASVMVSAGGWWNGEPERRMGLTIVDGVLVQDWEPNPAQELGNESAVFMKDGSLKIYDRSTPGATIIAEGGWNAASFGRALFKDGVQNPAVALESRYTTQLSGRNLVGVTNGGTILFIMFPGKTDESGAILSDILTAVAPLNIKHLYFLDGGGSAQMWIDGKPLVASSDIGGSRNVPDVYHFNAPRTSEVPHKDWVDVPLTFGTGTLAYRATRDSVEIEFNVTGPFPIGSTNITDAWAIPGPEWGNLVPRAVRRGEGLFSGSYLGQASVSGSGQITVTNPTDGERSQVTGHIFYQRP